MASAASVAQELIIRRELLLARLRDEGALILDLDRARLTSAVLNQISEGEGEGDSLGAFSDENAAE